jgi:hypothetical protein
MSGDTLERTSNLPIKIEKKFVAMKAIEVLMEVMEVMKALEVMEVSCIVPVPSNPYVAHVNCDLPAVS